MPYRVRIDGHCSVECDTVDEVRALVGALSMPFSPIAASPPADVLSPASQPVNAMPSRPFWIEPAVYPVEAPGRAAQEVREAFAAKSNRGHKASRPDDGRRKPRGRENMPIPQRVIEAQERRAAIFTLIANSPLQQLHRRSIMQAMRERPGPQSTRANIDAALGLLVETGRLERVEEMYGYYRAVTPRAEAVPNVDISMALSAEHADENGRPS